jgi:uncharacterized protein
MKNSVILSIILLVALFILPSCVPACSSAVTPVARPSSITLGALPLGSTYYAIGLGLGTTWEKKLPGYKIHVEPLASMVVVMQRIKEGKVDISFTNVPSLGNASRGLSTFADVGPVKIRAVAALWVGNYAFWTGKNTGIKSIKELSGKRVQWFSPGVYMSNVVSEGLLEYYGINSKTARLTSVEDSSSIDSIVEGRLDSFFSMAGSELTRLDAQVGIQSVDMPGLDRAVDFLNTKTFPSFKASVLKKDRYGLSSDIITIGTPVYLLASAAVPEDTIYDLVKSLVDNIGDFRAVHPELKDLSAELMVSYPHAIPWHPGSVKFFRERGLWTPALDAGNSIALKEFE